MSSRTCTAAVVGALALAAGCTSPDPPDRACPPVEEGYRALFDGTRKSLDGWRMAGPGSFELQEDCSLRTVGGMGLLWFPEELADYRLRLDWKVAGDDNSGVFIGFPEPGDDPWVAVNEGYEIQIDATDAPDRTTGAIYLHQGADGAAVARALEPPGEWNTYEITVEGRTVTVHLNGVLVTSFDSDRSDGDLSGHVGLQNHGEDDDVYFRDISVAELVDR
ncbi:3-keto-disaccharide hydrolase [Georgenia sp. Marseille-Q6866]